jgi:osmotically-inducible protein OsmY
MCRMTTKNFRVRNDITEKIRGGLTTTLGPSANHITVALDGRCAILYGNVYSLEQWNQAEAVTRGIPGVSTVRNYLSLSLFL